MVAQPPQQVYNAVHPIAAQSGVPDPIWETVAYMESGYNPNAVGDAGTSYGLFQLHEGGQLRTSPASVMGSSGVPQNALEAMPDIGIAWQNLKSSFNPNSIDWWTNFASQSGHPGGGVGNVSTQQAAQAMLNDYSGNLSANNINQTPYYSPSSASNCPGWCALLPFQSWGPCVNCSSTDQGAQNLNTALSDLTSPPWWARVGVIILGGGLVVIGAIKLLK